MVEYLKVGRNEPKIDAITKAIGKAEFVGDLRLPDMLYGKLLRSIHPHARILNIKTEKARRIPGVKAVVTAQDLPDRKFYWIISDQTIFARGKVRYMGEPVAGVAAESEEAAIEAIDLIEVDYQPLPEVFDPEEAMKPDAPIIHEELSRYRKWTDNLICYGNVCCHLKYHRGDVDGGFKEADRVFEDVFTTQSVYQAYLEPKGAIANLGPDGKLTIWSSTQTPFPVRFDIADALGMPFSKVNIISPFLGGGFGGKAYTHLEPYVAALALQVKRPVKIVLDRYEDMIDPRPRNASKVYIKTGVKKDGTLVAREYKVVYDAGAFAHETPGLAKWGPQAGVGFYNVPNLKIESIGVYTNKIVTAPFRGYGTPQVTFAGECQMDMIARELGIDPLEIRMKNGVNEGDPHPVLGYRMRGVSYKDTLRDVTSKAGWVNRAKKKLHGWGIASMAFTSGGFNSGSVIKLNEDGTVNVLAGKVDMGQGVKTVFTQMVSEILGIPPEKISLAPPDTEYTPFDFATVGDSGTHDGGRAVMGAAKDVRDKVLRYAAERLEADLEDLELRNEKVYVRGAPQKSISLAQISLETHYHGEGQIIGRCTIASKEVYPFDSVSRAWDVPWEGDTLPFFDPSFTFATQIAEVEVDPETGKVKVLNFWAAHDCGKAINPRNVEGQIEGAVAQGMGYALTEEIVTKMGVVINPEFLNYLIPSALDMPQIHPIIVEAIDPKGPFGAKGMGEPGLIPVAPAIVNAISDAIGVRIKDLPVTPEKILKALETKMVKGHN